jgi:UTP--glucose-1-phosphate uridylyltransferase
MTAVDTAIVPLAGLATRMQPLARSVPKEMLPLGDRPVLHHVVAELAAAGVEHVVLVVGSRSEAIERYFHRLPDLDDRLDRQGRGRLDDPHWTALTRCTFSFVRQDEPSGVADAVGRAARVVGDRPFIVHMGDSVVWRDRGLLGRMVGCYSDTHADVTVAVGRHLPHPTSARAVAEPAAGAPGVDRPYPVRRLLPSPRPDAPDLPFVVGRFLLRGPIVPWVGPANGFGRIGGLTPLVPDPDGASVMAVPLLDEERLLGAGTLAEYHASWRQWLGEVDENDARAAWRAARGHH